MIFYTKNNNKLSLILSKEQKIKLIIRNYPGHARSILALISNGIPKTTALIPMREINIWNATRRKVIQEYTLNKPKPVIYLYPEQLKINAINPILKAENEKQQYLPPIFPRKDYVSGLMSLTPKEEQLLRSFTPEGEDFRRYLGKNMIKVVWSHYKADDVTSFIKNAVGHADTFKTSPQVYKIISHRIGAFLQHFIISYNCNIDYPFEILKKFCDLKGLKCYTYEGNIVKTQSFIEAVNANRLKMTTGACGVKNLEFHLINSEDLAKSPIYFNEVISTDRTGQKHADLLIVEKIKKINNIVTEIFKYYIDIKSYPTLSVYKCRFSLIHPDEKLMRRLVNDLMTSLKKYITENALIQNDPISELYDELKQTRESNKNNITVQYQQIMLLLIPYMFNPKYDGLKIGIALETEKDNLFDEFYQKIEIIYQTQGATIDYNSVKIITLFEKMFPKVPIMAREEHINNIRELIDILIPEPMRAEIRENFENTIVKAIKEN